MAPGGPVIGICAAIERVSWGVWESYEVTLAPRNYVDAVQRAGGLALVLPPDPAVVEDPALLLDRVDALLLAGGADLDPAAYGAEPHEQTKGTWPERDRFEIALVRAALALDMPVLGICRGMQVLNVALGGTLEQHLADRVTNDLHRTVAGTFGSHRVELEPESLACRAAGSETQLVMSHHHQGVDRVGNGLRVSGRSPDDEIVEAVELPNREFALGVIWHPEEDPDSPIIASLVDAARGSLVASGGAKGATLSARGASGRGKEPR